MINTYSPWGELRSMSHVELRWEPLPSRVLGEYRHDEGSLGGGLILLDPCQRRHQARCTLSHELGHALAGDRPIDDPRAALRQEFLADDRAARLLVDVSDLADAMALCEQHQPAVARELQVTLDVVRFRLKHLDRDEWHFVRDRLAGLRAA